MFDKAWQPLNLYETMYECSNVQILYSLCGEKNKMLAAELIAVIFIKLNLADHPRGNYNDQ